MSNEKEPQLPIKTRKANALVLAKHSLTLQQNRIVYLVINKLRGAHDLQSDLFKTNVTFNLSAQELALVDEDNLKRAFRAGIELRKKDIYIKEGDSLLNTGYFNWVRHNPKSKSLDFEVSNKIMPYFLDLATNYTSPLTNLAFIAKSKYTQRLYEICNMYKGFQNGNFFKEIADLREMFELEDSYKDISSFTKYVLDVAQKELETIYKRSDFEIDLYFTYHLDESTKIGKKYTRVIFKVHAREANMILTDPRAEAIAMIEKHIAIYFPKDRPYIDRIINELTKDADRARDIVNKLAKKFHKYPNHADRPPIVRTVLKKDFGIV